jgi:hypothetical protein
MKVYMVGLLTIRWIAPMPPQLTALAFSAIS